MNSFIKNNSLLKNNNTGPCDLDWRIIGSSSWDCYQQSILDTITSATVENVVNLVGSSGSFPGGLAYVGGVLLSDGRVFCVPHNATQARTYDPSTNTVSLVGSSGSFPGTYAYAGGVLLSDGRVFCVPYNATRARVYGGGDSFNINVLLSAYLNKF